MKRRTRLWIGVPPAILLVLLAAIVWVYYPQISNLKNEYMTAAVIRDLDAFVESNPGSWPDSWSDLGDGSDRSQYTQFRFDIEVTDLLEQPDLIYQSVSPISSEYRTYPHAKAQLDEVLRKLKSSTAERISDSP